MPNGLVAYGLELLGCLFWLSCCLVACAEDSEVALSASWTCICLHCVFIPSFITCASPAIAEDVCSIVVAFVALIWKLFRLSGQSSMLNVSSSDLTCRWWCILSRGPLPKAHAWRGLIGLPLTEIMHRRNGLADDAEYPATMTPIEILQPAYVRGPTRVD